MKLTPEELKKCDEKADAAIKHMLYAIGLAAAVPAHVNWALTAAVIGGGCASVGMAYGVKLDKEQGWALGKQFLYGAGTWFLALNVGSKFFAALAESTGLGYGAGVALDVTISCASAWAIGGCARKYFRTMVQGGAVSKEELKELFRESFKEYKTAHAKSAAVR